MKVTGVIRRIDELGRIVIPKEIRRSLRIKEGENLEIYLEDDDIILRRFSSIKKIDDFAQKLLNSISSFYKKKIFITDTNTVVATTDDKKIYLNKEISNEMNEYIKRREKLEEKYNKDIFIIDEKQETGKYIVNSILLNGDSIGLVIMIDSNDINDIDTNIINFISNFISQYLEC